MKRTSANDGISFRHRIVNALMLVCAVSSMFVTGCEQATYEMTGAASLSKGFDPAKSGSSWSLTTDQGTEYLLQFSDGCKIDKGMGSLMSGFSLFEGNRYTASANRILSIKEAGLPVLDPNDSREVLLVTYIRPSEESVTVKGTPQSR